MRKKEHILLFMLQKICLWDGVSIHSGKEGRRVGLAASFIQADFFNKNMSFVLV